ncbi:MAG: marine proteobacterial sortase target protein [Gammaproteobacteria bacterium]|nr:marine proteobacterial sortase target protein [Gammaproteobacteria bacterium]
MQAFDSDRRGGALPFVLLACLLLTALGARAAGPALPPDIGAGMLLFRTDAGFDQAAPLSTDVRIAVSGIVARVTVGQRFRNTGAEWTEAVYAFPLPDGAAVDRMSMRVGDRTVEGVIREKEQAERIYSEARESGQRASLVTETTPNLFTTSVANIAPGETIDVTIGYLDTARYDAGEFSLRFPMTLTPRYEPAKNAAAGTAPPPAPPSAPAPAEHVNEAALHVTLTPGVPVEEVVSRHHDVRVTRHDASYRVETASPTVAMDRDFVVAWRPRPGAAPTAAALTERVGDTSYALLMILPPADDRAFRAQPREVIYVVDTSGSMAGASMTQAKLALADALGRLSGGDRFNVFQFNSTTSSLYRLPTPWTAETHAQALRYVERLTADGGTEMAPAIQAALSQPVTPGYLRQVVFLTDGGVSNETELFRSIEHRLGDARLFTIGIGAAPNSYFMRKAARFGRGTYTHIGDANHVAERMEGLFAKLERVALTDVLVGWPDAVEYYPQKVPDLYAGEPIVVTASLAAATAGVRGAPLAAEVFGRVAGAPWSTSVTAVAAPSPGIAALWARRRIEFLIDSRVAGIDESVIRRAVTDTALEHGLVSPYTSLVAVDLTPARSEAAALARRAVGNMLPAGTVLAHLPQAATPAALLRWLGMMVLAAAALLWWPFMARR